MRLAARKKEAEDAGSNDPDIEDPIALETSSELPTEPLSDLLPGLDIGSGVDGHGSQTSRARLHGATDTTTDRAATKQDHFESGLDSSSSSSSTSGSGSGSDYEEEDDDDGSAASGKEKEGEPQPGRGDRRPSTTEAKFRIPLDDEDVDMSFSLSPSKSGVSRHRSVHLESPFADALDLSDESDSGEESDEGDIVEIKPTRRNQG